MMHANSIIPEEDIQQGAHYRARRDMLKNVRGYSLVKKGLERRIVDIERQRMNAQLEKPCFISTSGVPTAHHKSPLFKTKISIGNTEPRVESVIGLMDVRRKMKYLEYK